MSPEDGEGPLLEQDKLKEVVLNIIKGIPHEGKKELFTVLSKQVEEMNLKDLGLAINYQGLQKEFNKELFIKLIGEALEPGDVNSKMIEEALQNPLISKQ